MPAGLFKFHELARCQAVALNPDSCVIDKLQKRIALDGAACYGWISVLIKSQPLLSTQCQICSAVIQLINTHEEEK